MMMFLNDMTLFITIGILYVFACGITFNKLDPKLHDAANKVIKNHDLLNKLQGKK